MNVDLCSRHDIISLCSGIAGLDLGIKLAIPLARTVCYVEREVFCCAHLVQKMEEGILDEAPVWTDVKTFDGKPWHGLVDGIHGGYPCQPFSVAGERRGEADPRHLWPDIARIVAEIQPRWCFFENVRNHLRLGFEQVRDDLQGMGYTVRAGLFSAAEVGASHRRERLFILAHRVQTRLQGGTKQVIQRQGWREKRRGFTGNDSPYVDHPMSGRHRDQDQEIQAGWNSPFPPGPEDTAAWEAILREWPKLAPAVAFSDGKGLLDDQQSKDRRETKPTPKYSSKQGQETKSAIRRMVNGTANRVDRIRACGNAVVPLVAAKAFITLARDY